MKIRSRELNIFSMSALDLFASALGAFILLTVIALPYFANTHHLDDETLLEQLAQSEARRQQTEVALAQCRQALGQARDAQTRSEDALNECQRSAKANFLLVLMSWTEFVDIDLHVIDPQGREFSFSAKAHSGTEARFEEDNISGPGNEIWLHPMVSPGVYRVDYVFYSGPNQSVSVRGAALHRDGKALFPNVTLTEAGQRKTVAYIEVSDDGTVRLR